MKRDEENNQQRERERKRDERDNLTNKLNTQKATMRCKKLMLNSTECHKGYIIYRYIYIVCIYCLLGYIFLAPERKRILEQQRSSAQLSVH